MELVRDFIVFQASEDHTGKIGFSSEVDTLPDGKYSNVFGATFKGIYSEDNCLIIDLDRSSDQQLRSRLFQSENVTLQDGETRDLEIQELGFKFPLGRFQLYKIKERPSSVSGEVQMMQLATDQYTKFEATAERPIFDYTLKQSDKMEVRDSDLKRRIVIKLNDFALEDGENYCLAVSPNTNFIGFENGIGQGIKKKTEYKPVTTTIANTDIRTATYLLGKDNSISVSYFWNSRRLDLFNFYRFRLIGLDSEIDTDTDKNAICFGKKLGELVIFPRNYITRTGEYETTLIGYSPLHENGVILWNSRMIRSRLKVVAI